MVNTIIIGKGSANIRRDIIYATVLKTISPPELQILCSLASVEYYNGIYFVKDSGEFISSFHSSFVYTNIVPSTYTTHNSYPHGSIFSEDMKIINDIMKDTKLIDSYLKSSVFDVKYMCNVRRTDIIKYPAIGKIYGM